MKLSIVVPFYNEEKNILFVLEEYKRFEHNYDFESEELNLLNLEVLV